MGRDWTFDSRGRMGAHREKQMTEPEHRFEVWEYDGGHWWHCATFKLKAHASAFSRMMTEEFARKGARYEIREPLKCRRRWWRR